MLSTIVYEGADFIYTIGKLTIRGVKSAYSWFYKQDSTQLKIKLLEERVTELESVLKEYH
jgi:hypothetical protein